MTTKMTTLHQTNKQQVLSVTDLLKFYRFQQRVFDMKCDGDKGRYGFITDWKYDSMGHVEYVLFKVLNSKDIVETTYWKEIIFG